MAANHELILEQEAAAKKTSSKTKRTISTPSMVRSSGPQEDGNNPNDMKHEGKQCAYKCRNCGGEHVNRWPKLVKYFNCGKLGHIKRDCKLLPKEQKKGKARNNLPQNDKGKGNEELVG